MKTLFLLFIMLASINFMSAQAGIDVTSPITNVANCTTCDNSVTIGITDAAANGTTKGAATYTTNDFESASGVISIDYENGQKADENDPGFVSDVSQTFGGNKKFENKAFKIV